MHHVKINEIFQHGAHDVSCWLVSAERSICLVNVIVACQEKQKTRLLASRRHVPYPWRGLLSQTRPPLVVFFRGDFLPPTTRFVLVNDLRTERKRYPKQNHESHTNRLINWLVWICLFVLCYSAANLCFFNRNGRHAREEKPGDSAHHSDRFTTMLGPNNGQYATLSKQCKTLESADFYWEPERPHYMISELWALPEEPTTHSSQQKHNGARSQFIICILSY